MGYRIENVIFFPEKNEFLITRAGRHRVFAIYQRKVMVRIKGFENYYLDVQTGDVCSKRSNNSYSPLKKTFEGGKVYYWLYVNGSKKRISLFQILEENLNEVSEFFTKNKGFLKAV